MYIAVLDYLPSTLPLLLSFIVLSVSTILYYWISHTVNCRHFPPSPYLEAQSVIIDQEVDTCAKKIGSGLHYLLTEQPTPFMVGIFGRNSIEVACTAYSMTTIPLYETLGHNAVQLIMEQTGMVTVVCDNAQQADQLVSWNIPSLRLVVVIEESESLEELQQKNNTKALDGVQLISFTELLEPKEEDICLILYTSGSTGSPKGVTLTHRQFVNSIMDFDYTVGLYNLDFDNMMHLSYLPLPHVMEQVFMLLALYKGAKIAFLTTDIRGLSQDLAHYRPTHLIAVPRILSRVYNEVLGKIGAWRSLRWLMNRAITRKAAEQTRGEYRQNGILDRLVCSGIRKRFGDRIRLIMCAGAPLSPDVDRFASAVFSCPVLKAYGSTETCGIVCHTLLGDPDNDTVGALKPGAQVRLADVPDMGISVTRDGVGEICVKTHSSTSGYYHDDGQTKKLFDAYGFIRMGDIGEWTSVGALRVVDRCKSVFKLSQGEYVAPERVEQVYATSPLVLHVLVDGNSMQAFPVALVVPCYEQLLRRCITEHDLHPDLPELPRLTAAHAVATAGGSGGGSIPSGEAIDNETLCRHHGVRTLVLEEFTKIGKKHRLKGFEQVKSVYLCPEPFTSANGLLTPTLKVARATVRRRFASQIAQLYEELSI